MAQPTPTKDGRQARWEKHNRTRRQQILDAAMAVIEAAPPGSDVHVQQIAEEAGLNRTVVYRHFADRADLDREIQAEILRQLSGLLVPEVTLDGTVNQIIVRVVSTYVEWVVAHPALHHFAQQGAAPMEEGIQAVAGSLVTVLETAIDLLGAELSDDEREAVDPLAYGLVGAVMAAVTRWINRPVQAPSAASLARLLSESVWNLLDGHARRLGLQIDPDQPLDQMFGIDLSVLAELDEMELPADE